MQLQRLIKLSVLVLIALGVVYIFPWNKINWGTLQLNPGKTITVVGQAEIKQKSQMANFSAGVAAVNDNKNVAVQEVNKKTEAMIESVKEFGIPPEDIKTQNLSIYQGEQTYYEESVAKTRPGQWRVNNSIDITLRDINKASELADLLSKSGATSVYGPKFSLEDTKEAEASLFEDALKDAGAKAEVIARSSGRELGKAISVTEGAITPLPIFSFAERGDGGGPPIEPGSETISKTVTVVFEME